MFLKNNSRDTNSEKVDIIERIESSVSLLVKQLENIHNEFNQLFTKYGVNRAREIKIRSFEDTMRDGMLFDSDGYKYARELTELIRRDFRRIKESALGLTELLEESKKEYYQNKIKSIDIEKIQKKKIINVKEFTEIYGYSSDWQKNRRQRIRDRLPFIQTIDGGKIIYSVSEIELWFENNNISL